MPREGHLANGSLCICAAHHVRSRNDATILGKMHENFRVPGVGRRNSCYRSADILVRLGLANAAEADKNVRAPFAFLHVVGNCELRPSAKVPGSWYC